MLHPSRRAHLLLAPGVADGEPPASLLRPVLVHLRDPARVARLQARLIELLEEKTACSRTSPMSP